MKAITVPFPAQDVRARRAARQPRVSPATNWDSLKTSSRPFVENFGVREDPAPVRGARHRRMPLRKATGAQSKMPRSRPPEIKRASARVAGGDRGSLAVETDLPVHPIGQTKGMATGTLPMTRILADPGEILPGNNPDDRRGRELIADEDRENPGEIAGANLRPPASRRRRPFSGRSGIAATESPRRRFQVKGPIFPPR